jgi:hypothetical protein
VSGKNGKKERGSDVKKVTDVIVTVLFVVGVYLLGRFVLAPIFLGV